MNRKITALLAALVAFLSFGASNAFACQSGWGTYNTRAEMTAGDTALNQGSGCTAQPFREYFQVMASYYADGHGRLYGGKIYTQGMQSDCANLTSAKATFTLYDSTDHVVGGSYTVSCTWATGGCNGVTTPLATGIPATNGIWMPAGGFVQVTIQGKRGTSVITSATLNWQYHGPQAGAWYYVTQSPPSAWASGAIWAGNSFCIL